MKVIALALSLLWRTAVVYFVFGLVGMAIFYVVREAGINLISDETATSASFIKAKPTVIYSLLACMLLLAEYSFRINLIRLIRGKSLMISPAGWHRYVVSLSVLLFIMAVLNVLVAVIATTAVWVNCKFFGGIALLLFGHIVLAAMLMRERKLMPNPAFQRTASGGR